MKIDCYSRRLLSPFHGVQQVIDIPGGIAESMDGFEWKLYVADERIVSHTGLSEVRYGNWNPGEGRQRAKIRGASSSNLIEAIGDKLIEALEIHASNVPFPLADRYECWLLHADTQLPLALLDSELSPKSLAETDSPSWYPGGTAAGGFQSKAGKPHDLTALILRAAGDSPTARWFERETSGVGIDMEGTRLPNEAFPPLLLKDEWPRAQQQQIVSDYLNWQAPWLLQLSLSDTQRRRLELAAWQRPLETNRVYRLFPKLIDSKGLTVTRVKARMLQESPTRRQVNEPFYPFVNE